MRQLFLILCAFAMSFAVAPAHAQTGCRKGNTGKVIGGLIGALGGGILGNKIDGGRKRGFGTVVGALAGALAGSQLGKSLDKCQQEAVEASTQASLASNTFGTPSRRPVQDPYGTGTIGYTETVRRSDENGIECRMQRVVVVDPASGEDMVQPIKQCRTGPNGGFQPVTGRA